MSDGVYSVLPAEQSQVDWKSLLVKPALVAAIAAGVAYGMGDSNQASQLFGRVLPTYQLVGVSAGASALVAGTVKNFVLPYVQQSSYSRYLTGRVLDNVIIGGATALAVKAAGNTYASYTSPLWMAGYAVAGNVGAEYVQRMLPF